MNTNTDESPLPTPPFHTLPNIHNLRDAALSVTISTGASLRPNILFRSADVSKLDIGDWKALNKLGVAHVFDLRSKPEIDKTLVVTSTEDKTWIEKMQQAGVTRTWTPIFSEHDYSPEKIAVRFAKYMEEDVRGFVEAYTSILNEAGPAFGVIFRYLADLPAPGSTGDSEGEKLGALVHCTAGKDRTGLFYAVLFAFLDVPAEQIAVEYNLTELGLRSIREGKVELIMQSLAFQSYMKAQMAAAGDAADGEEFSPEVLEMGRQAALRMFGARRESMMGTLDVLNKEFGGAREYMKTRCGLDDGVLERLRRNLVVGGGKGIGAKV
ncbi:Protein tyrosine serine phosphatase [Pyrenophora tritici-repentis]|uniref:Tyrosine phosphatase protein n=2 Tax=Pyrenophora tritici-repentis TaxID=45151 RepID=A0A2W1EHF6_9PLEO|nr:uncharacterized protein PTRG_02221 [Pyrenophora tritici-repentis Pt-1C-BFP]KAA8626981.1 Protein tyrosine-serine phosphatase [Pyrenophora tritici-repentis]EDU41659.1 conserved hypothetical protein [Pyrenophora tritici-repentis Pt-1C-BFP]KAF7455386.1 Protein tyrosine-serine phosphatase [Pyrenophora tritici-repentis]KAG9389130.1 Protein tyrosine-serine phosphatase [Pyrenophora tritici-repentis]KAI0573460.1 Protein tyrosine-serine phosphatase [Pyrenophora tritici-repentis]